VCGVDFDEDFPTWLAAIQELNVSAIFIPEHRLVNKYRYHKNIEFNSESYFKHSTFEKPSLNNRQAIKMRVPIFYVRETFLKEIQVSLAICIIHDFCVTT